MDSTHRSPRDLRWALLKEQDAEGECWALLSGLVRGRCLQQAAWLAKLLEEHAWPKEQDVQGTPGLERAWCASECWQG